MGLPALKLPDEISRTAPLPVAILDEPTGNLMDNKMSRPLYEADTDIAAAIENETRRQHEGLERYGLGIHQQVCRGLSG